MVKVMNVARNLVVAQSGGPTPVINSSLRGIIEAARQFDAIGTVYGARHGIEGVLKEELLDLSAQSAEEVALLRFTPGRRLDRHLPLQAASRSQTEDFDRVIEVLRAHQVGYLLYIGGNDSMDTANKIAQLAQQRGLDLVAVGVPKTIDNDVGDSEFQLIDHTPGYGSVARYWMHKVQTANEENAGSCPADPVLVMQAMGRKIGFIPAAARLADPDREMPLLIYLAESPCTLAQLADQVNDQLRRCGRCMVVISEGFDVGDLGDVKDAFGHTSFGASQADRRPDRGELSQPESGCRAKAPPGATCRAPTSGIRWPTPRRSISTRRIASARRPSNWPPPARAASWPRSSAIPGPIYSVRYDKVPLAEVANSERTFPEAVDRPERLRRDRRFRPLRQAAGGQRHDQPADDRRPPADDPLRSRFTPSRNCRNTYRKPTEQQ